MKKGFALFTLLAFLSMGTFTVFAQDETNTGNEWNEHQGP